MDTVTLNDGNQIPVIGFGVYMVPNNGPAYEAALAALRAGYRHLDTAAAYMNEEDIGRAVRDSGLKREEIFITSKLWIQDFAYDDALKAVDTALKKLKTDYIDLYLIHQPYGKVNEAWRALEKAKAQGKLRSIGVDNMTLKFWEEYVTKFDSLPAVNQFECNPYFQQRPLRKLMDKLNVKVEAYFPLRHGDSAMLNDPAIVALAQKYGKNPGQIILRFEVQDGLIVLPKSTTPQRIKGNIEIFDFYLTDEEMALMRALDTGIGAWDPEAPGIEEKLLALYDVHR